MKMLMNVLWVVIAVAALGFIPDPYGHWLTILGLVLLIAHLAEYFIFNAKVKAKGDTAAMGFINTMLYGLFYWAK